jgi:transcriptional regulator with XRE-family HTH domain
LLIVVNSHPEPPTGYAERMTMRERLAAAMDGPPPTSQAALARAVGISQPTVNNWLSGQTKTIRGDLLVRVAAQLDVRPEWLANGDGPMRPTDARESQPARTDPERMRDAMRFLELLGELQDCPELVRDPEALCIAYDFLEFMDTQESNVVDITRQLAARLKK